MDSWLIVTLVTFGYLFVSLVVGILAGRRASSSTAGYVVAAREYGFIVMYFVMGASIFSAFAFLGGPGWAYSRGAAAFYILSYGTVGLAPWYFFGPRVAALGRKYGYVTQADLFAHRFQSPALSVLMAIISLVCFLPYLILQMEGAGYVFDVVTEGRVPPAAGAAIAYGVVLIYVYYSGVMGAAFLAAGVAGALAPRLAAADGGNVGSRQGVVLQQQRNARPIALTPTGNERGRQATRPAFKVEAAVLKPIGETPGGESLHVG